MECKLFSNVNNILKVFLYLRKLIENCDSFQSFLKFSCFDVRTQFIHIHLNFIISKDQLLSFIKYYHAEATDNVNVWLHWRQFAKRLCELFVSSVALLCTEGICRIWTKFPNDCHGFSKQKCRYIDMTYRFSEISVDFRKLKLIVNLLIAQDAFFWLWDLLNTWLFSNLLREVSFRLDL